MRKLNNYQRLIAEAIQPAKPEGGLPHRNLFWTMGIAALVPVIVFLLIYYPLQAAVVILLAASILVIGREEKTG